MKSSYEVRAQVFINQIYPFIKYCDDPDDYRMAIRKYNNQYHRKVIVRHGMTRVVLITSDYVVKVDYGTRSCIWGSCADECEMYKQAEHDGYEYLFAKITPVQVENHIYYIMPRIRGVGCSRSGGYDVDEWLTEDENDWLNEHCFDLHYENYGWHNMRPIIIDYASRV